VNTAALVAPTVADTRAQRRLLAAGMLCYGFDALDFMMLAMAMPLLIAEWHLTLGEAGLLGTAGMLGVGLSGLALGWYSDRHGRRRALLVSVAVFALFTAAIAFAQSPTQVMVLRFLAGFGIGGVWGAVTALIKESWPAAHRVRAISWVLAAFPLGVIAAALLAWLWSLPCPVINRYPSALWYRPQMPLLAWQRLLRSCGIPTMETLVTNVESEARDFRRHLARNGVAGAVYGPLTSNARYLLGGDCVRLGQILALMAATSGRQVSAGTWKRTWDLWCIKARAQIEMEQKAKRRRGK